MVLRAEMEPHRYLPMKPPVVISSDTLDNVQDAAAAWFAYMQSGDATPEGRQACRAWRDQHPEHDRQYRNMEQIWQATLDVPQERLRALATPPPVPRPVRRRLALGMAGACAAAVAGAGIWRSSWLQAPNQELLLVVERGARREVTLDDGSVLLLNSGTQARVRLYADRREVQLRRGEVFFSVQPDPSRPFRVQAGEVDVLVTGTQFNVRHEQGGVQIAVQSGSVQVSSGPWWRRSRQSLSRGQGVEGRADQLLGSVRSVSIDAQLAWTRGKIVFEDATLEQAIAEINRYLPQPARLESPAVRQHRIAGIFSIDDAQSLLDLLPEFAPVQVYRLSDGQARIVAR